MRFAFEAGFLILVAFGAALAELGPVTIVGLMACAWLLVALIERASSREAARAAGEEAQEVEPAPEPAVEKAPEPPAIEPREAYRWLFWRRARPAAEELPSPTATLEERPARSHVRRIEKPAPAAVPEPEPRFTSHVDEPEPEPTVMLPSAAEPPSPGPAVTTRPLDLPGLDQPVAPAPPEPSRPRGVIARATRRIAPPPPPPPPEPLPREWNLWDLERRAREQARHAPRDEEWSALFTHLRVFVNADGVLPKEFDGLVRESFGELIEAA